MTQLIVLAINIIKIEDQDLPWSGRERELALCLKRLFGFINVPPVDLK
jgi:hypothetical protein